MHTGGGVTEEGSCVDASQQSSRGTGRARGAARQWPASAQRIEALVGGQADLFAAALEPRWEEAAQHYAAQVIRARAQVNDASRAKPDYHSIDVGAVDVVRPRNAAVEHIALAALRQVGLDDQLAALGFNGPQQAAAIGTLIGRMVAPGSELATHQWLQQRTALGELIDFDFTQLDLMALYRIADRLLAHKPALEAITTWWLAAAATGNLIPRLPA